MQCVFATRLVELCIEEVRKEKTNGETIPYCWCEIMMTRGQNKTKQGMCFERNKKKKKRQEFHTKRYSDTQMMR